MENMIRIVDEGGGQYQIVARRKGKGGRGSVPPTIIIRPRGSIDAEVYNQVAREIIANLMEKNKYEPGTFRFDDEAAAMHFLEDQKQAFIDRYRRLFSATPS